jgi:hypothetical protein
MSVADQLQDETKTARRNPGRISPLDPHGSTGRRNYCRRPSPIFAGMSVTALTFTGQTWNVTTSPHTASRSRKFLPSQIRRPTVTPPRLHPCRPARVCAFSRCSASAERRSRVRRRTGPAQRSGTGAYILCRLIFSGTFWFR